MDGAYLLPFVIFGQRVRLFKPVGRGRDIEGDQSPKLFGPYLSIFGLVGIGLYHHLAVAPNNGNRLEAIIGYHLFVTIYGVLNEVNQFYVDGRSATLSDALLNAGGAMAAVLVLRWAVMPATRKSF